MDDAGADGLARQACAVQKEQQRNGKNAEIVHGDRSLTFGRQGRRKDNHADERYGESIGKKAGVLSHRSAGGICCRGKVERRRAASSCAPFSSLRGLRPSKLCRSSRQL